MTFTPGPVDPALSPRHLLGATLRYWRDEVCHLSLAALAEKVWVDSSNLGKWERGERLAPPDAIQRIDELMGARGILIALRNTAATLENRPHNTADESGEEVHSRDMEIARRQILTSLTAISGVAAIPLDGLESLRHLFDRSMGPTRVEDWEETAWEYAHALNIRPLPEVIADLSLDVLAVHRYRQEAPIQDQAAWARINAQMTYLLAHALGANGQTEESRRWWVIARRTAEETGDGQLIADAYGKNAMQALYEQRPAQLILDRADYAITAARGTACAGVASAFATRAQLAAVLGDERGASAALGEVARVFERLPEKVTSDTDSVIGWSHLRLLHTRSYVATYAGLPGVAHAQRESLEAYSSRHVRPRAQIMLHEALSAVKSGDIASGLDHTRDVLTATPVHHRCMFVRRNAETVLEALPPSERTRPIVAEIRELMAPSSPHANA